MEIFANIPYKEKGCKEDVYLQRSLKCKIQFFLLL